MRARHPARVPSSEIPRSPPRLFTIAVAGHRHLTPSEAAWLDANAVALLGDIAAHVGAAMPAAPIRVVSALAAGADQKLAAATAARPATALQVLLPFARHAYRAWLTQGMEPAAHAATLDQFDRLCASADAVVELDSAAPPAGDRAWAEARYVALGGALVARADLLLALWRGDPARGPGGTAEVVALAVARGVPVIRLDPRDPAHGTGAAAMDAVRLAVARYRVGQVAAGGA